MNYRLESIDLLVREMPSDRMSFSIGKRTDAGETNSPANRRPSAILVVRVIVVSQAGERAVGCSGDRPSFGWLDKRPETNAEAKLEMLLDLVEQAGAIYLDHGVEFGSPFGLWRRANDAVFARGREHGCEDLMSSYASALFERAVIDAVCRLEKKSFFEMVRANRLGIDAGAVHPELATIRWAEVLPAAPRSIFQIRHTVGLGDPIDGADLSDEERIHDGEPETLAEYAERDGLRYFKIKISGDPERDLERLGRIWRQVLSSIDQPVVTLDGNEAYSDIAKFEDFIKRFEAEEKGLFQHTLFVEQPLTRALTLDQSTGVVVRRIARSIPLVIDEADGTVDAFRRAFSLGYSGCSHKNCKGVFKSLLNLGLVRHFEETTDREPFLTGEDLSNMPIVPLHQDFAALGVLGIDHCERNGHHYAFGLSHLGAGEKEAVKRNHPELYVERDGELFLRIENGSVRTGSLHGIGFGTATLPDWNELIPLEDWRGSVGN